MDSGATGPGAFHASLTWMAKAGCRDALHDALMAYNNAARDDPCHSYVSYGELAAGSGLFFWEGAVASPESVTTFHESISDTMTALVTNGVPIHVQFYEFEDLSENETHNALAAKWGATQFRVEDGYFSKEGAGSFSVLAYWTARDGHLEQFKAALTEYMDAARDNPAQVRAVSAWSGGGNVCAWRGVFGSPEDTTAFHDSIGETIGKLMEHAVPSNIEFYAHEDLSENEAFAALVAKWHSRVYVRTFVF